MYNKIFSTLFLGIFLVACSEDTMDEINKNVNDPADVPSKFILTDAITASAFSVTGSDLCFYASCYIEHNVGVYGQLYDAEIRNGEVYASSTYDNSWKSTYQNLNNLKKVISKCSVGGNEAGNNKSLGIAQILTAYNLAILTDVMGDIPWTEALQAGVIFQPKLDKQDFIYSEIFKLLNAGIENLGKTTLAAPLEVGSQDLIYGGKKDSWIAVANGLKARYTMRLSFRNADYANVIALANASFTDASGEFKFNQYDGSAAINPLMSFYYDRDYFGASQSLHDKLVTRNDPRDAVYFLAYSGDPATVSDFAPNGTPDQAQGFYGVSGLLSETAPTYMLSYHELLFLKAEAYARINDLPNAEMELANAISAAFERVGLSATDAQSYFTSDIKPLFDANPLLEIAIQKNIAFYQDEALEAYNDYRRQAALGTVIPLANTKPFPQRFTYGSSDVTTNPNVRNAYGDGSYVKTEKVWWAGGTR